MLLGYSLHPSFTNKVHKVLFDILQFEQVSNTFSVFLCDAEDDWHGGQCEMCEQVADIVDIKDKLVMFDVVDMDIIKTLLTWWLCENMIIVEIRWSEGSYKASWSLRDMKEEI